MNVASDLQQRNRIIPFTNSICIIEMCQILFDLSLPFIIQKIPLYIKSNSYFDMRCHLKSEGCHIELSLGHMKMSLSITCSVTVTLAVAAS